MTDALTFIIAYIVILENDLNVKSINQYQINSIHCNFTLNISLVKVENISEKHYAEIHIS